MWDKKKLKYIILFTWIIIVLWSAGEYFGLNFIRRVILVSLI
uniref:Uncharacterized protein n=1 Tax=Meloidogyne enterolobii TaxID=390850 RepID=A0A6V7XXE9_MELEN|nr:unnamed protein product [Meloidogyne enterolobii]